MGLTVGAMAAREVVSGTVEKVDAMKGQVVVKTPAGPREFNLRAPEKLMDVKAGDKIEVTIQEDGSAVIVEQPPAKK
ncbi:MAG: hypothetical protein A2V62_12700 [Nitrospirae bacterium RBG_19FT_COMBO_58_9]|nr:MAG: hypothetical protein A2V62_12700 [Nitrospirae bacterium RBG_19FT_COMBO_58_9]